MKLLIYSDFHLEFGSPFRLPRDADADILILAGDVITFRDYAPFDRLVSGWEKPAIFVAGNHEYYTQTPMEEEEEAFAGWLENRHPNVRFLRDESVSLGGAHFFGGTMWTDFDGRNERDMEIARRRMNDFRLIKNKDFSSLSPGDTVGMHARYVARLLEWFEEDLRGPRVVISHHAPAMNPETRITDSPLTPAFNSLDMLEIIERYRPDLWIYGHTHECDDHTVGGTRIVSNQRGYPEIGGGFECEGFDESGLGIEVRSSR